jgi:thiol-disulfide isomerase/thioredoxin
MNQQFPLFATKPAAVRVKIIQTVGKAVRAGLVAACLLGCTSPTKPAPMGSEPTTGSAARPLPQAPSQASSATAPAELPAPSAGASATPAGTGPAGGISPTGSAYFGCGKPIPHEHLWDETTESEVFEAINAAKACARANGRRLLLELVAPWCGDCREMARLDATPVVSTVLQARFERVRINVGKWDRHEALRQSYEVKALATYIVIDPVTSKQLAKTTLEPISKRGPKLTADDWARWLASH